VKLHSFWPTFPLKKRPRSWLTNPFDFYGRIDGAVNNAGIATEIGRLADLSTEEFQKLLLINILGVFWCMKDQVFTGTDSPLHLLNAHLMSFS
jgi:hypothetical protein